jgi:ParB family chromosome partitioning protein
VSKSRGLPTTIRMRHDTHFVDSLVTPQAHTVGRMIDLALLDPNPEQPRRTIGEIGDLVASIKEKGLLEPLIVRPLGDRFQIIAGERRYHAAKAAGLSLVPCIELDVDERGVLEISLIENLQRRDLDPFEESDAISALCDRFEYTHDKIARKLGKSRTSVTEMLGIARIPETIRELCRRADISSKSLLIEVARQPTDEAMLAFVERIAKDRLSRDDARKLRAVPPPENVEGEAATTEGPRRGFVLKLKFEAIPGTVQLRFANPEVRKAEILQALRELIARVENADELPV